MLASYWKDNRIVYYLSTFHKPMDDTHTASHKNKDGTENILSSTPTVVLYAQFMGGVDRLDQNTRISKSKKSLRRYRKIEVKLREITLYNAYILEGNALDQIVPNKTKRDMLSF